MSPTPHQHPHCIALCSQHQSLPCERRTLTHTASASPLLLWDSPVATRAATAPAAREIACTATAASAAAAAAHECCFTCFASALLLPRERVTPVPCCRFQAAPVLHRKEIRQLKEARRVLPFFLFPDPSALGPHLSATSGSLGSQAELQTCLPGAEVAQAPPGVRAYRLQ